MHFTQFLVCLNAQRVYSLLPPPYRDVWLEWLSAEENAKKLAAGEDVKVHIYLLTRTLAFCSDFNVSEEHLYSA